MNTKELIEIAKQCGTGVCHFDCPYHKEFCMESLMTELASRLEKRIPKKVYSGCCPVCGRDGYDEYGRKNYCSGCGQTLDWSIKNEK